MCNKSKQFILNATFFYFSSYTQQEEYVRLPDLLPASTSEELQLQQDYGVWIETKQNLRSSSIKTSELR